MARTEFPKGLEGSENLPRTRKLLQNCFWTQTPEGRTFVLSRPGIKELIEVNGGVARGDFVFDKSLYMVFSQDLIKITDTDPASFSFTVIGTIEGTDPIQTAVGFNDAVIVVNEVAGKIYALSNSKIFIDITSVTDVGGVANFIHAGTPPVVGNTITIEGFINNTAYNITGIVTFADATNFQIDSIAFGSDEATGSFTLVLSAIDGNANFVPCTDVAHINGRFVYIPFDGDPAFFSDIGAAGTVQVLSFFDAEALPDKNNAVFNFRETLYIMGTDSIQPFKDKGASPNPFVPTIGGRILNGFIGALLEYNNTFLFIGREKDQDFGIYRLGSGVAPKISNEAIDLLLSTYTQDELAGAIPGRFKWRGFDIATFTLPRDSFGFLNGNWFKLDTVFDGESRPWGGGFITQFEGKYYTAFSDKIGRFEKVNTDYGNRITRIMETLLAQEDTEFFSVQSLELGIAQGFNKSKGSVALQLSNDNVLFGPPLHRDLGDLGQYDVKLAWNYAGGLGTYRGFMGIRFSTIEDVDFTNDYITTNIRG